MTEEQAKACEACVETQQRVNDALATSDACWRMEQEVIVRVRRARPAKRQYLGQHKCVACPTMVRVYDWLPSMLLCAKCARQEARNDRRQSGSAEE
jgi:hypothetical protein